MAESVTSVLVAERPAQALDRVRQEVQSSEEVALVEQQAAEARAAGEGVNVPRAGGLLESP